MTSNNIDIVKVSSDVDELKKELATFTAMLPELRKIIKSYAAANKAYNEAYPTKAPVDPKNISSIKEWMRNTFSTELQTKLSFDVEGNNGVIRFLKQEDKATFKRIAEIVDTLGGTWISDKEKSRFEVPITQ